MLLQYLPLTQLNVADDSFRVTFAPNIEALKKSIKSIGVIQPILARHTVDGAYQVVCGYKRILACQALGRQTIPVLVVPHTDMSPMQAFITALHDNVLTRSLNLLEKSIVCVRLTQTYGVNEDDFVRQYMPLMGESTSYKTLHLLSGLQHLIEPMKQHVVATGINLTCAARIAEFSPSTQQALMDVVKHIKPNSTKLNELLCLIREIASRDAITVEEVLQRYQLLSVVVDNRVSASEKIAALRQTLKGVRLPQMIQRKQEFSNLIKSLGLPETARIATDPYFEDSKMKLQYEFSEPEELSTLIQKLQTAFETHSWDRIFEWYREVLV
ncbi:MAG: hypothetical protein COV45_01545 [Deltaproteobacteria bacterium CG11_big_fil_rev_8_21_14_0_20_47_16]|nr:MAG: hypothetical protein COV45_01545 [Deltaproteobacteria bacterium CG11_big_fil_rev_8_21_14_0_20_47_16]